MSGFVKPAIGVVVAATLVNTCAIAIMSIFDPPPSVAAFIVGWLLGEAVLLIGISTVALCVVTLLWATDSL